MLLRRIGRKTGRLSEEIQTYFPEFNVWIEPFFGAGGMFFSLKKKCRYYFVTDTDEEIFNFFLVWREKKEELKKAILLLPYDENLFMYWKKNKETDPVKKALRFYFLSNCSLKGFCDTLHFVMENTKKVALENLEKYWGRITQSNVFISNRNCFSFINQIGWRPKRKEKENAFVYCDPPYCDTNAYERKEGKKKWCLEDLKQLIELLILKKFRFAISEQGTDQVRKIASLYKLRVIELNYKGNLVKNPEVLLVNYEDEKQIRFF